jgi:hypothetical protein
MSNAEDRPGWRFMLPRISNENIVPLALAAGFMAFGLTTAGLNWLQGWSVNPNDFSLPPNYWDNIGINLAVGAVVGINAGIGAFEVLRRRLGGPNL